MDWYFRSGIDDFCVVPKDQELSDRLPSPDSWSQWGISSTPESFGVPNKYSLMVSDSAEKELNFDDQMNVAGVDSENSLSFRSSSSSFGMEGGGLSGSLDESSLFHDPEFKLGDLAGVGQTDDIFLNSVLEDLPGDRKLPESLCFSPECRCKMSPTSASWLNMIDSLNTTSTNQRCVASSECLDGRSFWPPGTCEGEVTTSSSTPSNAKPQGSMSHIEAPSADTSSRYQQVNSHGDDTQEMSLEASVLYDLELVMAQLTENTRICLRDALYRLAANSRQRPLVQSQSETCSNERFPSMADPNNCMRSVKKEAEAETNTFDRAIANILFNKMDFHMEDFPTESFANSNHRSPEKRSLCN